MGACISFNPEDPSILTIVKGTGQQALSRVRVINHTTLWDEYCTGEKPIILGSGMNGPVLKIFSKRNSELVYALKEIKKEVIARPSQTGTISQIKRLHSSMLLNELLIYLDVDHANIAKIYEVYESATSVFIVSELCEGGELFTYLKSVGKMNEFEAIYIVTQILRAVNYLHNLGVCHGDIKLENFVFMRSKSGILNNPLKLIDFGFSTRPNQSLPASFQPSVFGSPLYASPEKIEGKSSTHSDVWSIGVIAYMLLTGFSPFRGKAFGEVKTCIEKSSIPDLIRNVKNLSIVGQNFLRECFQTDPLKRISAKEALGHPWISSSMASRYSKIPKESIIECLESMVEYSSLGPLRRACIGLVAMHGPPIDNLGLFEGIFNLIDSNSDGYIQISELEGMLQVYGIEGTGNVFNAIDVRRDGRINFSEFLAATQVFRVLQTPNLTPTYSALIESVFRKLDEDNSGFISEKNLNALFGRLGYQGSQVVDLIKEGDFLGDGVISLVEFFKLLTGI
jgi:calcium-dependent protein kinase